PRRYQAASCDASQRRRSGHRAGHRRAALKRGREPGGRAMPLAKIHVVEGRYDEARIPKVPGAVQAALMNTLRVPPEDFYQLIFEFPKGRFLHTPSFVGMHYSDDLIILDVS